MSMRAESCEAVKEAFPPDGVFVECPETGELVFVEDDSEADK